MCWEYEIEYDKCFDAFDGSLPYDEDNIVELLKKYNVKIVDFPEFRSVVDEFLTYLHENGIIKPDETVTKPSKELIKKWQEFQKDYEPKDYPLFKRKLYVSKDIDLNSEEANDIVKQFLSEYPTPELKKGKIKIRIDLLEKEIPKRR